MTPRRAHFRPTAVIVAGILCALAGCAATPAPQSSHPVATEPAVAPAQASQGRDPFKTIAAELLLNVGAGKRIAIQPFRPADVPVPLPVAQGFNDSLARAIESSPDGPGVIVAREDLPRLFSEAEEFGEASGAQHLLESVRADVLVIGTVNPTRGGVEVSYKAFDARTGHQLAVATPHVLAMDTTTPTGLALDQALAAAADSLARDASDLKTVETLGITYQQSEQETPLGSYIGRELAGRLLEKAHARGATPASLLRPETAGKPTLRDGDDVMVHTRPGAYVLNGTIWDLGQDIEVRLSLRGAGERAISYGARIRRDSIPTSLQTAALPAPRETASVLQLSSDRGARPVYTVGEAARLVVQSARDGYLYCFHQASAAAGGGVTKIFPNPYHPDAHIRGGSPVHIPDDGMGFALRVYGPAGVESVRCFSSERDLAPSLPSGVLSRDLEPIGVNSLDDLAQMFRNLPRAGVADASLVMTITPAPVRTSAKNAP